MHTERTPSIEAATSPVPRRLLSDGLILPEQLTHPTSFLACGSGRLMKAVLDDAIHCLRSQTRELRRDAATWIFADEDDHAFSFRNICDALDIAPQALRARLEAEMARVAA